MPLTSSGLTLAIAGGLASVGLLGSATPQLAAGIANGLLIWLPQLTVQTVDAGSLGVGAGLLPLTIPLPLLLSNLLIAYAANGQTGPSAPLEATGLANGLSVGLPQGSLVTTHPGVGTGTGVARLTGPLAFPSLMQGFESAGIKGQGASLKATAISTAFVAILDAFQTPIPIVGSASPTSAGGTGFGKIL